MVVGDEERFYVLIPEFKAVIAKLSILISGLKSDVFWIADLKELSHVAPLLSTEIAESFHKGVKFREIVEDFRPDESQIKHVQRTLNVKSA